MLYPEKITFGKQYHVRRYTGIFRSKLEVHSSHKILVLIILSYRVIIIKKREHSGQLMKPATTVTFWFYFSLEGLQSYDFQCLSRSRQYTIVFLNTRFLKRRETQECQKKQSIDYFLLLTIN